MRFPVIFALIWKQNLGNAISCKLGIKSFSCGFDNLAEVGNLTIYKYFDQNTFTVEAIEVFQKYVINSLAQV